jgi:hypothetical protein
MGKIARYWPEADAQEILALLDEYGAESHESGRARVQLAILKLSEGDRERLPELVSMAKRDYRDVLAYAEYPEQMRTSAADMRKLTREEAKALRQRDRAQYLEWLES